MADSPLKAQWAEALGGWLALQPASANAADRENDRKAHRHTLLIRLKRPVRPPAGAIVAVPRLGGKEMAPQLSPPGPGQREKLTLPDTRRRPPWITPPRRRRFLPLRRR